MKERINYLTKHYLINGGVSLWGFMKPNLATLGFWAIVAAMFVSFMTGAWDIGTAALAVLVPAKVKKATEGLKLRISTKGLKDDNLKLYKDMAKRVKLVGEAPVSKLSPKELAKAVRSAMAKAGFAKSDLEQVKAIMDEKDPKGLRSIVKQMGVTISELKAKMDTDGGAQADHSMRAQVKKWVTKNQAGIKQIRSGIQGVSLSPLKINTRAANSPMTPANTLNSAVSANNILITSLEIENGVTEPLRREPTLWDYIRKGATSSRTYAWVSKVVPASSGAADFIAPGVLKPGISFEFKAFTSTAKKVAVSAKVATELLEDIDGMTSFIVDELQYQLKDHVNVQVATGVSSSDDIDGLRTLSVGFTATGLETTNPNNADAIRAVVAQMRSGYLKRQVTVFMNPIDKANMDMTKAISQGQYLLMEGKIAATIVEDTNVPIGYLQAAMLDYYNIKIYKGYTVSWGWENQDFTKNLVTAIAEMRIHQYFKTEYTGAFVYDTYANVKSAIGVA